MRINASPDIERVEEAEQARYTSIFLTQAVELLNNNLSFADNFNAKIISITFSAADVDTASAHGLGRVPSGYIVLGSSAATQVYDGASANTAQLLYLRASAASTVKVMVF